MLRATLRAPISKPLLMECSRIYGLLPTRVAIVAPREIDQYDHLFALTSGLAKRGLKIAVFYDSKPAVTWLADTI